MANKKIRIGIVSLFYIMATIFPNNSTDKAMGYPPIHTDKKFTSNSPLDFKKNDELADEWGRIVYRKWLRDLSTSEIQAIHGYSDNDYRDINEYLRENEGKLGTKEDLNAKTLESKIKLIDKALTRAKTPGTLVVYRRIGVEAFGSEFGALRVQNQIIVEEARKLAEKIINTTKQEHAYISTSLIYDDSPPENWGLNALPILLQITVPKGTRAGYIDSISEAPREREVLIARGYALHYHGVSIINEQGREVLKIAVTLKKPK